ncbi:AbrB/MazE/SpoVT family DNA-binding domain-containing protein [Bacillus capparidis]|uniref:AbrB/MazE/SpoVT family DNA-binding domain-containing protein n=1 Tax=Bacillus capparidis TaxID=1840411 RepID=UPI0035EEF3B9
MERKVTKIGKSYGVTFPLELLKGAGLEPGDTVQIEQKDGDIILRKSRKIELPNGISPDFFDVLEETMKEHGEALKGLVDR